MADYYIKGGDGNEYGPADEASLKNWVREGRADSHTQARRSDQQNWQPLGAFPEFQDVLVGGGAASAAASQDPGDPGEQMYGDAARGGRGPVGASNISDIAFSLARGSFWMKLLAVMAFISGGFTVLGIVMLLLSGGAMSSAFSQAGLPAGGGMLFVIPLLLVYGFTAFVYLYSGAMLWGSASSARNAVETGDGLFLETALERLRKLFTLFGVLTLIAIVLTGVFIVFVVVGGVAMSGMNPAP